MTHINHLQQLIPHQQVHQHSTLPTPPIHQPPSAPSPIPPETPTITVTMPSPPPTPPAFNPEEMINQMKMTFKEGLAAAVEKARERHAQQLLQPTPPSSTPPHNGSHLPPSTSHIHDTTHSSRRSRSPHHSIEPAKYDKRPISAPRSPRRRPRSSPPSRRKPRHHSPHQGRDRSVTLKSVSPGRRSSSYDFDREDRDRHRSHGHSSRPAEPHNPPKWHQQERSFTNDDHSQHHSHYQGPSTWQDHDTWGKWGNQQSTEKTRRRMARERRGAGLCVKVSVCKSFCVWMLLCVKASVRKSFCACLRCKLLCCTSAILS